MKLIFTTREEVKKLNGIHFEIDTDEFFDSEGIKDTVLEAFGFVEDKKEKYENWEDFNKFFLVQYEDKNEIIDYFSVENNIDSWDIPNQDVLEYLTDTDPIDDEVFLFFIKDFYSYNNDFDYFDLKDNFNKSYQGEYKSMKDFAQELFEQGYEIPEYLKNYINWDKVSKDLSCDYTEYKGHIFANNF